jgi:hypothetical protein
MRTEKSFFEMVGLITSLLGLVALGLFLRPIIYVVFGFLGGLVVKWVFGGLVIDGLNLLFGTTRFEVSQLPVLLAVLALIGGYFRSENHKEKAAK